MPNNVDIIKSLLKFDIPDHFYFLQIIVRNKENPKIGSNNYVLKNYFIYNMEYLEKQLPQIIKICDDNNARAYLRLNRRSARTVALQTLKEISRLICEEVYPCVKDAYLSCAGKYHNEPDKTWLVDIDTNDDIVISELAKIIIYLQAETHCKIKMPIFIPTKSGVHLITSPFRLDKFTEMLPNIDVHKDNPTLLYCK
jgi:hypothetical protein